MNEWTDYKLLNYWLDISTNEYDINYNYYILFTDNN